MEDNKTENITKQEAIQAMKEGKKVRHRYFIDDEWITIKDGYIVGEDGRKFKPLEFWQTRNNGLWEDGYSIVSEKSEDNKTKEEILRRHIAEFEGEDCTDKVWDEMIAEDGIAMPILKAMEVHTQQSTKHLQDRIVELEKEVFEEQTKVMNTTFEYNRKCDELQNEAYRAGNAESRVKELEGLFVDLRNEVEGRCNHTAIYVIIEKALLNTKS